MLNHALRHMVTSWSCQRGSCTGKRSQLDCAHLRTTGLPCQLALLGYSCLKGRLNKFRAPGLRGQPLLQGLPRLKQQQCKVLTD